MNPEEVEQVKNLHWLLLCVGFSAGAGFIHYSMAEVILEWLCSCSGAGGKP